MSSCNNTTYFQMIMQSEELRLQFFKYAFFTHMVEYNAPTAMMINKAITPIWIVLGTFGNIVSAIIWVSPPMRSCPTIAYYLTSLSLADLTFLIIQIFLELESPWLVGALDAQGWCQIFSVINISVQYFCVFLVFAFTIERFLSICYPFKSERFGKTRTPRIILYLLLLCTVLGIPQAYFWNLNQVGECQVRSKVNTMTTLSFYSIFTWSTELAIFGVLPLLVLFLNIAVVIKIHRVGNLELGDIKIGSKSREKLMNLNSSENSNSNQVGGGDSGGSLRSSEKLTICRKDSDQTVMNRMRIKPCNNGTSASSNANYRSTTITLLWVSFFLIFTMLPNTIMYALQHSVRYGEMSCRIEDMGGDPHWRTFFTFQTIKFIIKEISLSHHVANFFIYMATSGRFARQAMILFRRMACWGRSPRLRSTFEGHTEMGHPRPNSSAVRPGSYSQCRYTQQNTV